MLPIFTSPGSVGNQLNWSVSGAYVASYMGCFPLNESADVEIRSMAPEEMTPSDCQYLCLTRVPSSTYCGMVVSKNVVINQSSSVYSTLSGTVISKMPGRPLRPSNQREYRDYSRHTVK